MSSQRTKSSLLKTEWGNPHFKFSLATTEPDVHGVAEVVFRPWRNFSQAREAGTWTISLQQDQWLVESPAQAQAAIAKYELANIYATPQEAVKAVEFQAVLSSISSPHAPPGFHGALLSKGADSVGIVGCKEAGKSTLAATLWQNGYTLHSDDGLQIDETTLVASSICRRSRLRESSKSLFSDSLWHQVSQLESCFEDQDGSLLFHPNQDCQDLSPLKALILLRAGEGTLERLTESDGVMDLVVHCHRYYSEGLPAALAEIARLSNRVPIYRLGRGPLPQQLDHIQGLLK